MNAKHLELCASEEWAEAVERYILPAVLDGVELGDDVLEVGPGPGRTTDVLARLAPRLTAVEVDAALAEQLGARVPSHVTVVHADATSMPLPDGRFSAALSLTMLHHVPSAEQQDAVFAEVARVLRPGGVFTGEDSLDGPEFRELHVGDTCVPVEPSTLADRLRAAGFERVEVTTNPYAVRFRGSAGIGGLAARDREQRCLGGSEGTQPVFERVRVRLAEDGLPAGDAGDVEEGDDDGEGDEHGEANVMSSPPNRKPPSALAASGDLDQEEEDAAAVQHRERQQVDDAEVDGEQGGELDLRPPWGLMHDNLAEASLPEPA